ncbi:MAG: HEAT repeat domain-containing protein [Candidatus Desulfofervidaceae bacterium]|nr:HEAT repeat domain-containing protein [Candidatus Desulfofervidaceae bacterium]
MRLGPKEYPPKCPFCDDFIDPPKELPSTNFEYPVGVCKNCGAVYVYDVTGYHLGAAFVEALLFACNEDWDLAWQLLPEDDYLEATIEHYDGVSHKIVPGGGYEGRKVKGKLLFIRLHDDIQEVTAEGVKVRVKKTIPEVAVSKRSPRFSKRLVETLVKEKRLEELVALAQEDTRVIPALQRLLYAVDEAFRWQAIRALGAVSAVLSETRPDIITKLLHNLLYARSDSAASSWGALGATAEIITQKPELFKNFIPPFVSFFLDETARKEVLWGIGRLAEVKPELVKKAMPALYKLVTDKDPAIRGHAAWCLGKFKEKPAKPLLEDLLDDQRVIRIFTEGELKEKTVAQLAQEAIAAIDNA